MRRSPLERVVHRVLAVALGLSVVLLSAMVGIVTLNVASRYLLHESLTWSSELARYLMVWSAMLAAAVLVARGEHLAVELLERRLGPRQRRWMNVMVAVLSLTFFAVLFGSGTMLVVGTIGQVASSMEMLPMSAVYAIVPLSALLMFLGSAALLQRAIDAEEPHR